MVEASAGRRTRLEAGRTTSGGMQDSVTAPAPNLFGIIGILLLVVLLMLSSLSAASYLRSLFLRTLRSALADHSGKGCCAASYAAAFCGVVRQR